MNLRPHILVTAGAALAVGFAGGWSLRQGEPSQTREAGEIVLNERVITGLYTDADLADPIQVFRYLFRRLPAEATVFPTENYYYYRMVLRGFEITGSLTLFPDDRDAGRIGFSYALQRDPLARGAATSFEGGAREFGAADGVELRRKSQDRYEVRFEGRTVCFALHREDVGAPAKSQLGDHERYVGPSFDESGLRFHLVFNEAAGRLYWILNEDGFVPESFEAYSSHIAIGIRTGFAFYEDTRRHRRILIGVEGLQVLHNTWFDGPFDQMPDNYVQAGTVTVKQYLERHYGYTGGEIDMLGRFNDEPGRRVAVAPYKVYFDRKDLDFVEDLDPAVLGDDEFYAAITQQEYTLPASMRVGAGKGASD